MKTYVHLWQHLAELFLKWEVFHTKIVDEIKTHTHLVRRFRRGIVLCYIYDMIFYNSF
jgi:hypothetical protein